MWNNTPRMITAQDRLNICSRCPFSRQTFGVGLTCGTLLRPETDSNGNKLTCGCILMKSVPKINGNGLQAERRKI